MKKIIVAAVLLIAIMAAGFILLLGRDQTRMVRCGSKRFPHFPFQEC